MDAQQLAGWVAPLATTAAAVMTAANLGSRVTGWGFVVFTIGSVAWSTVAIATSQTNLLWTNAFLTAVNVIGIWRWLGRQVRHEDGSEAATRRSTAARVPTLFGVGALAGAPLLDRDGAPIGTVIDAMMHCDGTNLAYVVVSEGGLGGVGERLHAIDPALVRFGDSVRCDFAVSDLRGMPVLAPDNWPASLAEQVARG